jgi:hypothetical protein
VHIVGGESAADALAPHLFASVAGRTVFSDIPGTRVLRGLASSEQASIATV